MADLRVNFCGVELKKPAHDRVRHVWLRARVRRIFRPVHAWWYRRQGPDPDRAPGQPRAPHRGNPIGHFELRGPAEPGIDRFIAEQILFLRRYDTAIIANVSGSTVEEYEGMVEKISDADVDLIEMNISCPNVKCGGMAFGTQPAMVEEVVSAAKRKAKKPLIVKLSPNVTDITEIARAAVAAGADALSLINTLLGMRIDIETRRPILSNVMGGLSGPAVFPVAVRMVYQRCAGRWTCRSLGMGGIHRDAISWRCCFASADAVAMGTVLFADPLAPVKALPGAGGVDGRAWCEIRPRAVRRGRGVSYDHGLPDPPRGGRRHVYRRCHGQYDSLLTPRAYEQLPCLAKRFEGVPLDAVYASDLFRARTTAKAVAQPHGLNVELRPVLREIDMGDWEDLPLGRAAAHLAGGICGLARPPVDARPPHGESVLQAGQRMLDGVRGLVRQHEGGTIAVVTHGSAIRGALTIAHSFTPEQMGEIGWGDNTCVAKFEFDGPDRLAVVYENDASHLPERLSTFAAIGWKDNNGRAGNAAALVPPRRPGWTRATQARSSLSCASCTGTPTARTRISIRTRCWRTWRAPSGSARARAASAVWKAVRKPPPVYLKTGMTTSRT